jgi:hypothetical protein
MTVLPAVGVPVAEQEPLQGPLQGHLWAEIVQVMQGVVLWQIPH